MDVFSGNIIFFLFLPLFCRIFTLALSYKNFIISFLSPSLSHLWLIFCNFFSLSFLLCIYFLLVSCANSLRIPRTLDKVSRTIARLQEGVSLLWSKSSKVPCHCFPTALQGNQLSEVTFRNHAAVRRALWIFPFFLFLPLTSYQVPPFPTIAHSTCCLILSVILASLRFFHNFFHPHPSSMLPVSPVTVAQTPPAFVDPVTFCISCSISIPSVSHVFPLPPPHTHTHTHWADGDYLGEYPFTCSLCSPSSE